MSFCDYEQSSKVIICYAMAFYSMWTRCTSVNEPLITVFLVTCDPVPGFSPNMLATGSSWLRG